MEEGASRARNRSIGQRQPSNKRVSEPVAPQRRASWGSKDRPSTARQHVNGAAGFAGRSPSTPQTARNGTANNKTHGTPSRTSDGPGASPPGVHRVARQILAASPAQDVVHINLQHPITSYISPSQSSVSSKLPSPASPRSAHPEEVSAVHRNDEAAELLRAELVELKRSFQVREAQLAQQVESLCSELAAATCAKDKAQAEVRTLRSELTTLRTTSRTAAPSGVAASSAEEELKRQGQQLEQLQRAVEALEADGVEQRSAERSHVMHLEELVRSQQSQQQQFCSDLQALWAEVSRQRSPDGATTAAPSRARTGEDRMNDLAANVLLRNIYSAVSELP